MNSVEMVGEEAEKGECRKESERKHENSKKKLLLLNQQILCAVTGHAHAHTDDIGGEKDE